MIFMNRSWEMNNTCKDCRFFNQAKCVKFDISVNEDYKVCGDFAEKCPINESVQKMKLYD